MIKPTARLENYQVIIGDSFITKPIDDLFIFLNAMGFIYFAILHDKDIDENGEAKHKHWHIVIKHEGRKEAKYIWNHFSELLGCSEKNIQVLKCDKGFAFAVQYLIHLPCPDKYQYPQEDIISNDLKDLVPLLNEVVQVNVLTTELLLDLIIKQGLNRIELIQTIGINQYARLRNCINDIYKFHTLNVG